METELLSLPSYGTLLAFENLLAGRWRALESLGFRGFGCRGLGFRGGMGSMGFRGGFGFRGLGFRELETPGLRVSGLGFRVQGFGRTLNWSLGFGGFRFVEVLGFGLKDLGILSRGLGLPCLKDPWTFAKRRLSAIVGGYI